MSITVRNATAMFAITVLAIGGCTIATPLESKHSEPMYSQDGASANQFVGETALIVSGTITTSPPRRNNNGCLWKFQLSELEASTPYVIINGDFVSNPFTSTKRRTGSTSFYFFYNSAADLFIAPDENQDDKSLLLDGSTSANPNLILKDSRCPIS